MTNSLKLVKMHFKLNIALPMWIAALCSLTMLAPQYPRAVTVMFVVILISSTCGYMAENRSSEMQLSMPVRRSDIVAGRALFAAALQLIYLALCAAAGVISVFIPFGEGSIATSAVGMCASVGFFGITLIMYGAFNLVFAPLSFRKGDPSAATVIVGIICAVLASIAVYAASEVCAQATAFGGLINSFEIDALPAQLAIFAGGAAVYALCTFGGIRIAARAYERA